MILIKVPAGLELAASMSALGCNRNLLIENDFSYSPAHGIEMTFSEGNQFVRNRLVENAICGIWGGYSSGTVIAENEFTGNGGMAYGLERGAINMEHAADNLIVKNRFLNNKCAVHLWWDNDGALLKYPGVMGTEKGIVGNVIAGNRFEINPNVPFKNLRNDAKLILLQFRDSAQGHFSSNFYFGNDVKLTHPQAVEFDGKPETEPLKEGDMPRVQIRKYRAFGGRSPSVPASICEGANRSSWTNGVRGITRARWFAPRSPAWANRCSTCSGCVG